MIYDEIYSQNVTIDEDLSKLFDLQFSEFYNSFKNHKVLLNFLKYRTEAFMKYLGTFRSTSSIFPTLLKYNFGVNQLVDLDVVSDIDSKPYELITKRGGKQNFIKILRSLGVSTNSEIVNLVSIDPVIIVGAESNKIYPSSLTRFITDFDEITEEDLPLPLPIISSQYTINQKDLALYDAISKALLFDNSESLDQNVSGYSLRKQILMYLFLRQVIFKDYYPTDLPKYIFIDVVTPTSNMFLPIMKQKYPLISTLPYYEQLDLLLQFRSEYIVRTKDMVVNTSNASLNNLINNDISSGYFLTKLNMYWYSRNLGIPYQYSNVYPTMVSDPDIIKRYTDYFKMITNTLNYLREAGIQYGNMYPSFLKYLTETSQQSVLVSDFTYILKVLEKQYKLLNIIEVKTQEDYDSYSLPFVSIYEISKIISDKLTNYYPLYMAVADPSYIIKTASLIQFMSGIEVFTDPLYRAYYDWLEFTVFRFHLTFTVKEHSVFEFKDLKTHFSQEVKELYSIELHTTFHVDQTVKEFGTVTFTESHSGSQIILEEGNIQIIHDHTSS